MKNIFKPIILLAGPVFFLTSCYDKYNSDKDRSPVVPDDCQQVYFMNRDQNTYEIDPSGQGTYTVEVARVRTESAATVPIKVTANTDGVFTVPETVTFAAGDDLATFDVSVDVPSDGGILTLALALEGSEYVDPYTVFDDGGVLFGLTVESFIWEPWAEGTYRYDAGSGFAYYDESVGDYVYDRELVLYKAAGYERYRFEEFLVEGYNFAFLWNAAGNETAITPLGGSAYYTTLLSTFNTGESVTLSGVDYSVYYGVDADESYTFYNPDLKYFQFEYVLLAYSGNTFEGAFAGWYDDFYEIDTFLQGDPWEE